MITLMEVDTECRAWYIKADDRNAAIRALRDMGKEILPVESIYINGEDVSDEVFSSIAIHMGAPVDQGPSDPMPSGEAGMDSIPLPDEEPLENYALPPDDVPLPSLDDIPPEAAPLPPEAESVPEMDMPDILPDLTSVLPKSAFVPSPKDGGKKGGSNGIHLGRKHITGDPVEIRTITDEADGVIFTGTVISSEVRELRSKKKLFLMRLADDSNGIPCKKFFEDLCTVPELKAMSQRIAVAKMLSERHVYSDIVDKTGASTATISRVNRSLNYGNDGYEMVFSRMKEKETAGKTEE